MVAPRFVERMKGQLGVESAAFFSALDQVPPVSIRLHHQKGKSPFDTRDLVPWCSNGCYLVHRPSFHLDPHWHAGAYYVQEASSMILDAVLHRLPTSDEPLIWVDLCAAPGGKSGILARHMKVQDVLIANEVVAPRRQVLIENMVKGGYHNVFVTGLASHAFSKPLADIMLIDAPCSGEGMMRKDKEAADQWSESLVQSCSLLQRTIIRDAWNGVKEGGMLIYSTCSYSPDENMRNAVFIQKELGGENYSLDFPEEWGLVKTEHEGVTGFQLYPHRLRGEGLFFSVFQKPFSSRVFTSLKLKHKSRFEKTPSAWSDFLKDDTAYRTLTQRNGTGYIHQEAEASATKVLDMFPHAVLLSQLGEIKGKDVIPSHFLAMSGATLADGYEMDHNTALDFLERKSVPLPEPASPGWYLVMYEGSILGWMKSGGSGWKNHYPMSWRLRQRV